METMENNELNASVPKKKSKKGLIAGCVTGGVLLVGGGTFAILAATGIFNPFKSIQNTIDKATKSPAEYYKQVEGNFIDNSIADAKKYYDNNNSRIDTEHSQIGFQASLGLDSGIKSILGALIDLDSMGLSNLDSFGLDFTYGKNESEFNFSPSLLVNDEKVFTGNAYLNAETGETYVNVPDISDEYIDLTEEIKSAIESESDAFSDILDTFSLKQDLYPAYETLTKSIDTYKDIYFDNIKNVEESTEKLEAGGVSNEYTVLTVKISGEDLYTMSKAALEQAKEDTYVKEFVDNWNEIFEKYESENQDGGSSKIDYNEYLSGIDEAISALEGEKDTLTSYGDVLSMKVYVDNEGEIIGRDITVKDSDKKDYTLKYATVISDGKYGCDFSVSADGTTYATATGSGKYDLSNMDGDFTITFPNAYDNKDLNIFVKYENGNTLDYLKGIVSGDITITTDMEEIKDYCLKLSYNTEEKNGSYKITVGQKDVDFASFKIAYTISDEVTSLKPSDSATIIKSSDTAKLEEYIAKFDPEKIITNIKQKSGVELNAEEISRFLESVDLGSILNSVTSAGYEDDYGYDDDFDWNDDFDVDDDNSEDYDFDDDLDVDDDDYSFDDDTDDGFVDLDDDDTDVSHDSEALANKTFILKYVKNGSEITTSEDYIKSTIHFNKDGGGYFTYSKGDESEKTKFKESYLEDDFYVYLDGEKVGTYEDDILVVISSDSSTKLIYATKDADLSDYE